MAASPPPSPATASASAPARSWCLNGPDSTRGVAWRHLRNTADRGAAEGRRSARSMAAHHSKGVLR